MATTARNRDSGSKSNSAKTTPKANQGNNPHNTRQSGKEGPEAIEQTTHGIKNSEDGREYLESRGLLVPPGRPVTADMVSKCLHQILGSQSNIPPTVMKSIRSLAMVLDDTDTLAADQAYHDGFQTELDNFTGEIRTLIEDVRTKVDGKLEEISQATEILTRGTKNSAHQGTGDSLHYITTADDNNRPTYSQMLTRIQPDADPKMIAKHDIRRRQIMLEGIPRESKIGKMGDRETKEEVNRILAAMAGEGVRARATTRQRNGGLLVEMDSDFGAAWTRTKENIDKLCAAIDKNTVVKKRTYNLIVQYAPLSANPESQAFIDEVEEGNQMESGVIKTMRWAKPVERRSETQRYAHIIIAVEDANEANRLLAIGLYVCNRKLEVKKCLYDPIRCLKCQGWNHYARECVAKEDTCGHCGQKGHRNKQCQNLEAKHCTSCDTNDHASYDRQCPTFLKKLADKDRMNPENSLPFIPTDAPWTWNRHKDHYNTGRPSTPPFFQQRANQKERRQQSRLSPPTGRPPATRPGHKPTPAPSQPTTTQLPTTQDRDKDRWEDRPPLNPADYGWGNNEDDSGNGQAIPGIAQ